MLINVHFHIVEFYFHAVEQRVIICRTRSDLIKRIDHLDNSVQNSLWQHQTQVTRCRCECRAYHALCDSLRITSSAADQIAEPLYNDTAAKHVRKARDALTVSVAVLKRL